MSARRTLLALILLTLLVVGAARGVALWLRTLVDDSIQNKVPLIIMHAGGAVEGTVYTNSLDALERNYSLGARYFELDFSPFPDKGAYALVHDWDRFLAWHSLSSIPSPDEFRSIRIFGKFQSCDIACLTGFLLSRPDAWVITDTKYDSSEFYAQYPQDLRARTIFQAYSLQDVSRLKELGVPNARIILTIYSLARPLKYLTLIRLLADRGLAGLFALTVPADWLLGIPADRFPERWAIDVPGLAAAAGALQQHYCAHGGGIDEANIRRQLVEAGIDCFYAEAMKHGRREVSQHDVIGED